MNCHSPCCQPYKQTCCMIGLSCLLLAFVAEPAYNSLTQKTDDKLSFCAGLNIYLKRQDQLQTHAACQAWETLICAGALAMCRGQSVDALKKDSGKQQGSHWSSKGPCANPCAKRKLSYTYIIYKLNRHMYRFDTCITNPCACECMHARTHTHPQAYAHTHVAYEVLRMPQIHSFLLLDRCTFACSHSTVFI